MQAVWVHDRLTPLPFERAAPAMRQALRYVLGREPTNACLSAALAKCALETGRMRSCHCWNWGNIKAGQKYAGMYCTFELNEVLGGKVVWFSPLGRLDRKGGAVVAEHTADPPGHPQTRMRAHENELTGADAYVEFMRKPAFEPAFQRMIAGDVPGMVAAMKAARYFTADETAYAKAVVSIDKEYRLKLKGKHPEAYDPGPTWWEEIRQIIGPAWTLGDDAIETFLIREMDRELSAGPQAGRNVLENERE
jgi:hypothetical protein